MTEKTETAGELEGSFAEALRALYQVRKARAVEGSDVAARVDRLTMPTGALRRLLDPYCRVMAEHEAWRDRRPLRISSLVFVADHEIVVNEPVSAYPQIVTRQMLKNFLNRGAAHTVLAARRCQSFTVVDIGCAAAEKAHDKLDPSPESAPLPKDDRDSGSDLRVAFVDAHVPSKLGCRAEFASGCKDPRHGASLGDQAAAAAFTSGFQIASAILQRDKPQMLILGEMGIGNTTSSAALAEFLLNEADLAGPGTGVTGEQLARKRACLRDIRKRHEAILREGHPLARARQLYSSVGGFEHAALAGAALAAALKGVFVLLDGLIVTAAIAPLCEAHEALATWLVAGHESGERAHGLLLQRLGLDPLLRLGLSLGEGSGALLAAGLLADAHALVTEMATFDEAQVSES